jgi:MoaA/NifB/PqqE/SkfB family radical SAM enzyme
MSWLPPLLLHYYITERCNCRCRFCDIWRSPSSGDALPADVEKNVTAARSLGIRFVDFTGGEPLLHPHLPQMLHYARRAGLRTTLTSNALLYQQRAKELQGLVSFLHFSLDGATAPIHDRWRGRAVFDEVMESIEKALQLGEKPDILFTVTDENIEQLPELARLARSLRLILIVNPVFGRPPNVSLSDASLSYIESFKQASYVYINTAFHRLRRQGGNRTSAPRCRVMDAVIVLSPQNEWLAPCYHFVQEKHPVTNLVDMRRDRWFANVQNMQGRYPACAGCTINCYFDPSFSYGLDHFFVASLTAKIRYSWYKYLRPFVRLGRDPVSNTKAERA